MDCKFPSLSLAMSILPTEFFSVANPSLKDLETDFFDLATEKSVAKSLESCSVLISFCICWTGKRIYIPSVFQVRSTISSCDATEMKFSIVVIEKDFRIAHTNG